MKQTSGFTLIEISVVLVIIGLIVGGILTGRDLIDTAQQRAQITQIERYNTAVNTFKGKYGYLPGDIPDPTASQFGFSARGVNPGQGDGNGIIEGWNGSLIGTVEQGETIQSWTDLSTASLIEGGFISNIHNNISLSINGPNYIGNYLPKAKIGQTNYLYIWSLYGVNYFTLSSYGGTASIASDGGNCQSHLSSTSALTVQQAYNIDAKIDDGLPQTGSVTAILGGCGWAGSFYLLYSGAGIPGTNTSWAGQSSTTCFDNGGNAGSTQKYSIAYQNGANINCALTFKFQ